MSINSISQVRHRRHKEKMFLVLSGRVSSEPAAWPPRLHAQPLGRGITPGVSDEVVIIPGIYSEGKCDYSNTV